MTEPASPHPVSNIPGGSFPLGGTPTARIGYGMSRIALMAETAENRASAVALLRTARELGVTHFDTAQFYGDDRANQLLRESFAGVRDDIVIATKVGVKLVSGAPVPLEAAQKPGELRVAVEENLRTLGTDRVDIVNLRRMDFTPGLVAEGSQIVSFEDQLAEMVSLRDEGKILSIGLSHVTIEQLRTALPLGVACVQNMYSLVRRDDEPLLSLCEKHGIAWVPYFPLGGGFGTLPKVADERIVADVAERLGATPSQVGLAWQLAHSPNTMVIPGTSSIDHLNENVEAGAVQLDAGSIAELDALAQPA
ncbi:aldo/keto reductase [Paramicrobacterium chengjingii]|uniref:Aldo/keto reductase n=1 Tax=Paramicrobacterium chengjingii TaxID=2769067 RepID=A0ABX6YHL5_9MICO|nr:aldo/keto reductase [Microbacterium chengjingii]QPZ38089.1 aldo/keto reductase [Microbacterium chengjingii]